MRSSLISLSETAGAQGVSPYVVGAVVLGGLLVLLLIVIVVGGGRDHT